MKRLTAASAILSLGLATTALAELCDDIGAVSAQSDAVQMTLPSTQETVTCKRALMLSGGAQVHCSWAFDYRVPEASQAFEHLVKSVGQCMGDDAAITADLNVNHPDFYDLQTFELGGQEIAVSLKDKAALSQTYVFLRITLPR